MDGPYLAFLQIGLINVLLSGDNAVVIAMAAGRLPANLRKKAVWWGIGGAIVLRIVLALAAVWLLNLPLLQAAGAVLLVVIAVRLMSDGGGKPKVERADSFRSAVQTIIAADLVMSLDNVLAVAALSGGNLAMTIAGIALSVPLIPWGSTVMMRLLDRFPPLVYAGSAILGYAAGEMLAADRLAGPWLAGLWSKLAILAPPLTATVVLALGLVLRLLRGPDGDDDAFAKGRPGREGRRPGEGRKPRI